MPKGRRRKEKNILTILLTMQTVNTSCAMWLRDLLLCTPSESTLESAADEDYDGKHAVLRPQVIHRAAS